VGRRIILAVSVALALFAPGQARAGIPMTSCGASGAQCGTVVVPLDRSGRVPGSISLHVELLPAETQAVGVIFLIAGGPGQGSASAFDLGSRRSAAEYREAFPGYTLVAFDNRGAGKSGLIDCPALQRAIGLSVEQERAITRECANAIGPRREFYATRDHAEDIESVRTALGFGRIGLYGVSYGTKLALAYALAHPANVDRLVLDSVVPPTYPDPFDRPVLQEMSQTLNTFCAGGRCRGATSNYAADVAALANRLEAKRVEGTVVIPGGGRKLVRMNGEDLVGMIIDSDLSPGLAAELPAAVHAARAGYVRPLLRLFDIDERTSILDVEDLSFGLNVATNCADGRFPWSPETPVAARPALWDAAVAAQPAGAFGPFGRWAARLGTAALCLEWPSPAGSTPLGPGPFPNVPLLALNGGYDLRTPVANAADIVSQFPQGHLIVVPGVGHSVFTADVSDCAQDTVRRWIRGAGLPRAAACPRVPAFVKTLTAFPKAASARKTAAATTAVAAKTVREAEAAWLQVILATTSFTPAGLYGGKLTPRGDGFLLTRYSVVPGVAVSGKLLATGPVPLRLSGTIRVAGPKAVAGTLRVSRTRLSGTIGGRRVSAGL
jgi:pimeloyl-ACP methyl ester carboxylesterase